MIIAAYILSGLACAGLVLKSGSRAAVRRVGWVFFVLQALFAVLVIAGFVNGTSLQFFTFDITGTLFFTLMALVSAVVFRYGLWYLESENIKEFKLYNALIILLCASMACVYFSNNIAVTWIFLEATTLCAAGLVYHRRSSRSLEATWKYIFVCSVGIAMAYLGILLLGGMTQGADMSYETLARSLSEGNPLFIKIAFLFILAGFSCKLEIFPLYTIGVDANMSAPAPASALISTGLVNAGFVAIFRVYRVMENTVISDWMSGVLITAGLLSVGLGALFLRRTKHYKRFLSYSTVENMGIAMIGLGIGGAGVFAALLHVAGHSLLKSSLFLQISRVGKSFGHYHINRTGDYMKVNRGAAVLLIVTSVAVLAFPPSPLFISEMIIFKQMIADGRWGLLAVLVVLLCLVIYNFGSRILRLCYRPVSSGLPAPERRNASLDWPVVILIASAVFLGIIQPDWFVGWLNAM